MLVVWAGVLVIGADDMAPAPVPQGARDVVLQPVVGPEEVPGEAAGIVVEDIATLPCGRRRGRASSGCSPGPRW